MWRLSRRSKELIFFLSGPQIHLSATEFDHPHLLRAIDRVAAAVSKAGKWWGTSTSTPEAAQRAVDRGARLVTAESHNVLLVRGFQNADREFSELQIK